VKLVWGVVSSIAIAQMDEEKKIRRALVLCGGGAKGAYAFGCLKAFRERNIHFDAVAGTSVLITAWKE
jgi:predicted acylesterase/phospholipase RssA